jgi:hypothetical protein
MKFACSVTVWELAGQSVFFRILLGRTASYVKPDTLQMPLALWRRREPSSFLRVCHFSSWLLTQATILPICVEKNPFPLLISRWKVLQREEAMNVGRAVLSSVLLASLSGWSQIKQSATSPRPGTYEV